MSSPVEDAAADKAVKVKKNYESKISLSKIKKIMQANKEIGKISNNTPLAVAWVTECLIKDIIQSSAKIVQQGNEKSKKITPSHM